MDFDDNIIINVFVRNIVRPNLMLPYLNEISNNNNNNDDDDDDFCKDKHMTMAKCARAYEIRLCHRSRLVEINRVRKSR
jgi:hypothetical protein